MKWQLFTYQDQEYDLSHVQPFDWEYKAPATDKRPERNYKLMVQFSLHTFTRGIKLGETVDAAIIYPDDKEKRAFDFLRYTLSCQLPAIIRSLGERTCYHTHHGTFFTIEAVTPDGVGSEYEVYFKLSRASRKGGWLNLYVQSAYIRDTKHGTTQPKKRKIGFQVIAHNVLNGKEIKIGRQ